MRGPRRVAPAASAAADSAGRGSTAWRTAAAQSGACASRTVGARARRPARDSLARRPRHRHRRGRRRRVWRAPRASRAEVAGGLGQAACRNSRGVSKARAADADHRPETRWPPATARRSAPRRRRRVRAGACGSPLGRQPARRRPRRASTRAAASTRPMTTMTCTARSEPPPAICSSASGSAPTSSRPGPVVGVVVAVARRRWPAGPPGDRSASCSARWTHPRCPATRAPGVASAPGAPRPGVGSNATHPAPADPHLGPGVGVLAAHDGTGRRLGRVGIAGGEADGHPGRQADGPGHGGVGAGELLAVAGAPCRTGSSSMARVGVTRRHVEASR